MIYQFVFIYCVPTLFKKNNVPDLSLIKNASGTVEIMNNKS